MELHNKVAIVTGGAIRVGRAITLGLAQAGCHVFIHYGRSAQPALETEKEAQGYGVETAVYQADLADAQATQTILPAALARFGRVDVLINNAAIFPDEDSFTGTELALWEELFAINLRAPFLLSRAFVAQVPANGQGKIINVNDGRIRRPAPDHFVYRFTKGSLWQMTEMLALELAPRITVNQVALGAILPPPGQGWDYLQRIADQRIPLRRYGNAEMVAEAIIYLLRQDFLTGVTIPIEGGEYL